MNYDRLILKKLYDKYFNLWLKSSNSVPRIKINDKGFKEYFNDSIGYEESFKRLEEKGFIKIKYYKRDNVVDSIILNVDRINDIKKYLGISNEMDELKAKLLEVINLYDDYIIVKMKEEVLNCIINHKSINQYLSNDFIDCIRAIHYIEANINPIYERNLSTLVFNDSKRLSQLRYRIEKIYDNRMLYKEKNILLVPEYLLVKGYGNIIVNEQAICLEKLNSSIQISLEDINKISFSNIKSVTTIENLTTFYDYTGEGIIIYLGGFPTNLQIEILNKLKSNTNYFYHFGDIDYGGFEILHRLLVGIKANVIAIDMGIEDLANSDNKIPINDIEYIKKLMSLLEYNELEPYYEVIRYMVDNRVKLEQESHYIKEKKS